ncbi:hypothetical protein LSCM1_05502 [Leishmania martiniquensis]|uniref:BTB domain-containing protein n=1 Tax=Leishmania martiniquensis TaxID=1580590 RepID=A0A836HC95_9TRYP|nr:hypothetical protein LSCM1_05502 [Leishmania martiniquensis]
MASEGTSTASHLDLGGSTHASRSNSTDSRSAIGSSTRRSGHSGMPRVDSADYHDIVSPAASSPIPDAAGLTTAAAVASGTPLTGAAVAMSSSAMRRAASSGGLYRPSAAISSPLPQLPACCPRHPESSPSPRFPPPRDQRQQRTATPQSWTQVRDRAAAASVVSRHARLRSDSPLPRAGGDVAAAATVADVCGCSCRSPPRRSQTRAEERLSSPSAAPRRPFYFQPVRTAEPVCVATTASAREWVLLNVSGRLITTTVGTLMADPDSILASLCAYLIPPPRRGDSVAGTKSAARRTAPIAPREASGRCRATADTTPLMEGVPGGGIRCNAAGGDDRSGAAGPADSRGAGGLLNSASESGGGDAQTLTAEAAQAAEEPSAAEDGVQRMPHHDGNSVQRDGDRSSPPSDLYACHCSVHRSTASVASLSTSPLPPVPHLLHEQSLLSVMRESCPDYVTPKTPPPGTLPVGASAAEGGDGEAVSPQQTASAVPLDTDGANAILLDLDADYFLPILNYLRHGAIMIPHYISVDGVLAMAEYLNVMGLVRLLRGPQIPRRVMLFSWGSGGNGELGTHSTRDEPTPTMVHVTPYGVRVCEIALGANYSCALSDTGSIYAFGNGEWGQLGLGGSSYAMRSGSNSSGGGSGGNGAGQDGTDMPVELLIPRRIPLFEQLPAVHVAAGYAFAMAIVEGHHVYFWGNNNHGQSGRGRNHFDLPTKKVESPVLVETLEGKRIIQLSCGSFFALALSEEGSLYSWGLVDCVGLGTPEEVERRYRDVLGESLSNERRAVVLTPQLVTVKGRRRADPNGAAVTVPERIVRIRAGQWHSGAINEHGELFTWGVGYQGRLGHGSKAPAYVPTLVRGALEGHRVVDVACGSFHTVALTAAGAVFCWGDNASGQCGTTAGNPDAFTAPYRVVGLEFVAGGVTRSIACGRQHTVVVMEGPQPWCSEPCCRADAADFEYHSHAQVYCFGEASRSSSVGVSTASAVAAAAVSGATRGAVSPNHMGVSVAAIPTTALPASPSHGPFMTGGASGSYHPAVASGGAAAVLPPRSPLPFTGGHHHPHYQLVPGLQMVNVREVVSGLHHTFAYVEELCVNAPRVAGSFCSAQSAALRGREQRLSYAPSSSPLPPPRAASAGEGQLSHPVLGWGPISSTRSGGTAASWARPSVPEATAVRRSPSAYHDPWANGPMESSMDSIGSRILPLTRARTMQGTPWGSARMVNLSTEAASQQRDHNAARTLLRREDAAYVAASRAVGGDGRRAGPGGAV